MSAGSTADREPAAAPRGPAGRDAPAAWTQPPAHDTIVVGLGNPVLGDDGAGWAVADAVEAALGGDPTVRVERLAVGGLTLMEHLLGYRHAIVVDALLTGDDPPGTVRRLTLEDLPAREASHVDSAHDTSLVAALAAAEALGAPVPVAVDLVTIEAATVLDLRESLSDAVAAAVPLAADAVLDLVGG